MKTYTERSNCIRAARKALGSQAQVDVDFRVLTVPLEVDGAETSVQRFAWERLEEVAATPADVRNGTVTRVPAEEATEAQPEQEHRAEPHGPKPGSKKALMLGMLRQGTTHKALCEALGWQACRNTAKQVAEEAGLELVSEKVEGTREKRLSVR